MKKYWGTTKNGQSVYLYKICCPTGEYAVVSDYGATLVSVYTFDKNSELDNIILGYETLREYEDNPKNAGATIGRYANRIGYGKFPLMGKTIQVTCNRPPHYIHGGNEGFDKKLWSVSEETDCMIRFRYISADGEEGFPGQAVCDAVFNFSKPHTLEIRYEAETTRPTICSLTNHAYWNLNGQLSGKAGCGNTIIQVNSDGRTEQDDSGIPTGRLISLDNTPFDLRKPALIRDLIEHPVLIPTRGIDHTYAIKGNLNTPAARAKGLDSGRCFEISTNMPAMQVYLGGNLPEGLKGKDGAVYGKHSGFCMEMQHFPDAPNHPEFPSPVLMPGEKKEFITRILFGIDK